MIYKVNDTKYFNISMVIDILEGLSQINVIVKLTNKITNKTDTRLFKAADFADALKQYSRWEKFFIES